jgi:RNA polymerase sigma factor (sigma-70 family)
MRATGGDEIRTLKNVGTKQLRQTNIIQGRPEDGMGDIKLKRMLGQFAATLSDRGVEDGQLVDLFVQHRDEAAFAALLLRHGPMVLGVCRRVLGHYHDAEDAFQATFLILARKAASVQPPDQVGHWLYGVAHRTALAARRAAARRCAKETMAVPRKSETAADDRAGLGEVLDKELAGLPPAYREVIVLCDLEDRGRKEVAALLGCPEGTVASRLARARQALARRLARHGLAASTVRGAMMFAAGKAAGAVPARVTALAEGVIRAMFTKRMTQVGLLVLVALLAAGVGLATQPGGTTATNSVAPRPWPDMDKKAGDLKKLQGTWVTWDDWGIVWIIRDGKITEHSRPEQPGRTGTLKLDPEKRPRAIVISFPGPHPVQGIYQFDSDTLKVCLAEPGQPSPTRFKQQERTTLLVFRKHLAREGVVTAIPADLWFAYHYNEALADEEYTDRLVAVVGSVLRIRRAQGGYDLLIEAGKDLPLMFRFEAKDRKHLAKLKPGQLVMVEGKCGGKSKEAIVFSHGKIMKANE